VNLPASIVARGSKKVVLALLAILPIACETTKAPPPPFAHVDSVVRGNRLAAGPEVQGLRVMRGEATLTTTISMVLQRGDRLVTDDSTQAVIVFGDDYEVILDANTAITISPDFFVEFGKAIVKKLKEIRKKFEAETKYVNAGVEHTEFSISVDKGDVVSVVVLEGEVTLESTDRAWATQTISARQGAVVRKEQPPALRERIPQTEIDRTFGLARRVESIVSTEVPNLIGLPLGEARQELGGARLQAGRIRSVAGGHAGTVQRQSPSPGQRVRFGTAVDLDVAAEPVSVPDVSGMSQLEASIALGIVGLNVGQTSEEDDTGGRPGRVARQYPPPGTRVPPGTAVSLVIASRRYAPPPPPDDRGEGGERHEPERRCTVPDIRDVPIERASGILRERHLQLGSVRRVQGQRAGVTQNPEPGAQVRCGSSVDLVIYSAGPGTYDAPPENLCTVPDLRRVPVERAPEVLRKYNLQLGSVRKVAGQSASVSQNPEPGARVHCGSAVDLVVYVVVPSGTHDAEPDSRQRDSRPCIVPDLSRVPVERAPEVLRKYNLQLGSVRRVISPSAGISLYPEPGSRVPCGSSVDLVIHVARPAPDDGRTVETRPTGCRVPDVSRLSKEAAQATLKRFGLQLGRFQEGGDERGQSPKPNTQVPCGTAVDVFPVFR
jgi:beta-lactam-binding protein with PASTA domain